MRTPFKLTTFFICFGALATFGQSYQEDSLFKKTESLKKSLSLAQTLKPEELWEDSSIDINGLIERQLIEILSFPSIVNYDLDSLFRHDFLGIAHSKDKRLWIFNWYENTGGSFKSNISLVHYRNKSNKPQLGYNNENNAFCSEGAWFREIYKLKSLSKDIYLCLGSMVTCNSCCTEIASIVELTKDSINFNYCAFSNLKANNHIGAQDISPCFILDSRCGDIQRFEYNSQTQTIYFTYETDDNTPIRIQDNGISKLIKGTLKWNGQTFLEK